MNWRGRPLTSHEVVVATIAPTGGQVAPIDDQERARARHGALHLLADPRLTGMNRDELATLAQALAPAQQAQAAQRRFEQRGGQRRRAPGAGSTGLLSAADRVLVTVIYLRQICSQNVLSELLGINTNSIGQAIAETRQLLNDHHHAIPATTLRFPPRARRPSSPPATNPNRRARGCPTGSPIPP